MENTISNRQIFFILLLTLTCYGAVVISKDMAESSGTGAWITILVTAVVFALAAACIISLNNMFKGKTIVEYAPSLITKPGAYLLTFFFVLYYMFILVFLVTEYSRLLSEDFFPKTPIWAFPLIGIPLFCFIAYKGVTNTARLAEIIGTVFLITAAFVHILMASEGKVNRILPVFNPSDIVKYIEGIRYSIFSFLGVEVLLIFPLSEKNKKKPARAGLFSLLAIGLFYVLIVESSIMKLGIGNIINYDDPLIVAIRDTSPRFLDIIARLDILYLTVGFGGLFMGVSIAMLSVVEYLCRIFKNLSRLAAVISVGAVAYAVFFLVSGVKRYEEFAVALGTYLGVFASLIAPLILLIIAKSKNKKKKAGGDAG